MDNTTQLICCIDKIMGMTKLITDTKDSYRIRYSDQYRIQLRGLKCYLHEDNIFFQMYVHFDASHIAHKIMTMMGVIICSS